MLNIREAGLITAEAEENFETIRKTIQGNGEYV